MEGKSYLIVFIVFIFLTLILIQGCVNFPQESKVRMENISLNRVEGNETICKYYVEGLVKNEGTELVDDILMMCFITNKTDEPAGVVTQSFYLQPGMEERVRLPLEGMP